MQDRVPLSDDDLHRFARQLILSGFEEEHQEALLQSHVAVIGAGGLGTPLLQYLAAAGIGTITLFDDDQVEVTNLNRQVLHSANDIGQAKAVSAQESLLALDPHLNIHIRQERFTDMTELEGITLICDASDNPQTRYDANRYAHQTGIPLVFGGAVRMEGQMAVFTSGVDPDAACYQCLFPEAAGRDLAPGCSEAGILGPITGMMGTMMAMEAIRQCLIGAGCGNPLGPGLGQDLMLFDGRYLSFDRIRTKKNQDCPCCGNPDQ